MYEVLLYKTRLFNMNRFAALMAASLLASLVALGAEPTTSLPHTRAEWATAENDLGEVDPSLKLTNLTIVLNRPVERQRALDTPCASNQDPSSRNFPSLAYARGDRPAVRLTDEDIAAVSSWLQSQGLQVDGVASSRVRIEFNGLAGNVAAAFGAPLHAYLVDGEQMISRRHAADSCIARGHRAVRSRHSVRSREAAAPFAAPESGSRLANSPTLFCSGGVCNHRIGPADFASIYDVNPVYQQGMNGSGQAIAIVGARASIFRTSRTSRELRALLPRTPSYHSAQWHRSGTAGINERRDKYPDQSEATLRCHAGGQRGPGATIDLVISAKVPKQQRREHCQSIRCQHQTSRRSRTSASAAA